jgi:hypothetical protein
MMAEVKSNEGPGRVNDSAAKTNVESAIAGSRFVALTFSDDTLASNEEDLEVEGGSKGDELIEERTKEYVDSSAPKASTILSKQGFQGKSNKKGDGIQDKIPKESKLATRGGGQFKGKNGPAFKKGFETLIDLGGSNIVDHARKEGPSRQANNGNIKKVTREKYVGVTLEGGPIVASSGGVSNLDQKGIQIPNPPRPPNASLDPPEALPHELVHRSDIAVDNELFVDANDHNTMGSMDSDMEIVEETPRLKQ